MKYRNLDYFSVKPIFHVSSDSSFKTNVGASLTVIIALVISVVSYLVFEELWNKKTPTVNTVKVSNPNPQFKNIGGPNQKMSISFGTIDGVDPDFSKYLDIKAMTVKYNSTSYNSLEFTLSKCSIENQNENTSGDPTLQNSTYCLPQSDYIGIEGTYGVSSIYQSIIIQILHCANRSDCESTQKINEVLQNIFVNVYFDDFIIDTSNISKPFSRLIRNEYFIISKSTFTELNLRFCYSEILSDVGFIFTSLEETHQLVYDTFKINTLNSSFRQDAVMGQISIEFNDIKYKYYRSYMKIQDGMARVGGIFSFLVILSKFISKIPVEILYKAYLANQFFDMPHPSSANYFAISIKNKLKVDQNDKIYFNTDSNFFNNHSLNLQDRIFTNSLVRAKLSIGPCQSIRLCLKRRSIVKILLDKAYSKVNKDLSYENLFKSIRMLNRILRDNMISEAESVLLEDNSPTSKDHNSSYNLNLVKIMSNTNTIEIKSRKQTSLINEAMSEQTPKNPNSIKNN